MLGRMLARQSGVNSIFIGNSFKTQPDVFPVIFSTLLENLPNTAFWLKPNFDLCLEIAIKECSTMLGS